VREERDLERARKRENQLMSSELESPHSGQRQLISKMVSVQSDQQQLSSSRAGATGPARAEEQVKEAKPRLTIHQSYL